MNFNTPIGYSIRKAGIAIALAAATAAVSAAIGHVANLGLDPTVTFLIGSALTAALRVLEGQRDQERADRGQVRTHDVTFVANVKAADRGAATF